MSKYWCTFKIPLGITPIIIILRFEFPLAQNYLISFHLPNDIWKGDGWRLDRHTGAFYKHTTKLVNMFNST